MGSICGDRVENSHATTGCHTVGTRSLDRVPLSFSLDSPSTFGAGPVYPCSGSSMKGMERILRGAKEHTEVLSLGEAERVGLLAQRQS